MFDELKDQFVRNFITEDRWLSLLKGLGETLKITFFAVILGFFIGLIIAAVRVSFDYNKSALAAKGGPAWFFSRIINAVCGLYLTVIRGTPVVVQLMIMYYIVFASSNNSTMIAILAFGINSGAYVAEIFRGGILSVDRGQIEAGRSLGFSYVKTMFYIVLPQAFKNALPTLCNEVIVLLKETSVAGYVGIADLSKVGEIIRGRTFSAFMPLIAVALIYLAIVMLLTFIFNKFERWLRKSEH